MKKNTNSLVIIVAVLFAAMLFSQCRSKEVTVTPPGEVDVFDPCGGPDYFSDENFIRSNSSANSPNQQMSKRMARNAALEEMATFLNAAVSGVFDSYARQVGIDNITEYNERVENRILVAVDEQISGARTICERQTRLANGTYNTYMALELPISSLLETIDQRINQDDELRLEYNYENFKRTFDQEMERLRRNQ